MIIIKRHLVFNISHKKNHLPAVEYFFPSGPLALLPMKNKKKKCHQLYGQLKIMSNLISKKKKNLIEEFKKNIMIISVKLKIFQDPVQYDLKCFLLL